jgi:hypothetical protein
MNRIRNIRDRINQMDPRYQKVLEWAVTALLIWMTLALLFGWGTFRLR